MTKRPAPGSFPLNLFTLLAIGLVSVSLIGLQVALMRALSITRYHHFSYLVISTALLGFGASGTFLAFSFSQMKKHFHRWSHWLFFLMTLTFPLGYYLSQAIPLDIQYLLYSWTQLGYTVLFNLCIFLPFFFGAAVLGMALSYFHDNVNRIYGMDLLGSGIGGVVALVAMFIFPPTHLPSLISMVGFIALCSWTLASPGYFSSPHWKRTVLILVLGLSTAVFTVIDQPQVHIDQYKSLSHMQRLENQGDAKHLTKKYGPRGRIDTYASDKIHRTLFAGITTDVLPPDQIAVLFNGEWAGTIFRADSTEQVAVMDFTPQSLPYRLTDRPKVLLLGEIDGTNVWLAERFNAESITVVQTNPQIIELMTEDLTRESGEVYLKENVKVIRKDPRLFLEQTEGQYDVIQIVQGEGMAAGSSGLQSLHENYLLTTQSLEKCIQRLTEKGMMSFTRGVQTPPRDNIKFFGMTVEALENLGMNLSSRHILLSRNYLAANTIVARSAIPEALSRRFRRLCRELRMDTEYYPGIRSDTLTQRNVIPGPEGEEYSYYHQAAREILSGNRNTFYRNWAYNITPATDSRPYFFNFFKWSSLDQFIETYGHQWFQRLELGYVVLVLTLGEVTILGLILILLPLFRLNTRWKESGQRLPLVLHFGGIGFGFMFLEMVFIQRFGKFLGDPVYSAAATLTAILVFAGLGSLWHVKVHSDPRKRIRMAVVGLALVIFAYLIVLEPLLGSFIQNGVSVRFMITILFLALPAFLMGWLFPSGLSICGRTDDSLIPWAWGINGVASVAASPLAILLSMAVGFQLVMVLAVALYVLVGLNSFLWKTEFPVG